MAVMQVFLGAMGQGGVHAKALAQMNSRPTFGWGAVRGFSCVEKESEGSKGNSPDG